jgi:solute carrier family 25 oxoglutarate transporter 11
MRSPVFDYASPFITGGAAGMAATVCVQPLDMIKVRMQLSQGVGAARPSSLQVARGILAQGNVLVFYDGISAALARQLVYGTARLGLYTTFEKALKRRAEQHGYMYNFSQRALASIGAGGLGSMIGNPTEVALIRMQSDGLRPEAQRTRYRSVVDALIRITRTEGVGALWSGCLPTVIRAMCTNFGQLAFFSESKHQLQKHTSLSDRGRSLVASAIGGFFAAFFSMPADFVKSRLQSQSMQAGGRRYRGMWHCCVQVFREERPATFYRGFPAYFSRMAPHS